MALCARVVSGFAFLSQQFNMSDFVRYPIIDVLLSDF